MRLFLHFLVRTLTATAVVALAACGTGSADQDSQAPPLSATGAATATYSSPNNWAFPNDRVSAAYATDGMVTTTDRVASDVGVEIIRRGGNAVDAAVAVHFALAVVNPEAGNVGGGGFMVLRMSDGEADALDFRETAPLGATRDMFLDEQGELTDRSRIGHQASGVPGSVAGLWEAHQRFGTLQWAELLQPAVTLAEGLVVHDRLAQSLQDNEARLRQYPTTAETFLIEGNAPRVGDRLIQRDLANTLQRIATDGRDGFYLGRTAQLIADEMQRVGLITREDLASYEAVWRDPIAFDYRDHTVLSMPPPSSGGAVIAEILNILEGYDLRALGYLTGAHVHLLTEAFKRGFADRNAYLADPDFVVQPLAELISDAYATERRMEIDADRATPAEDVRPGLGVQPTETELPIGAEAANTTHYSIVDGLGNAVAVTTTLNSLYGSLVTVAGAGFLLNNEMDDFTSRPGTPNQFGIIQGDANAIEPGKRMLSSMMPTMVLDADGEVLLVSGSPWGPTIISTLVQMISSVVDFEMTLSEATAAPRVHHQHLPDVLYYEVDGLREDVVSSLGALGHTVEERPGFQGDTQSIVLLPDGTLVGVSDPRRGGAALGVGGRQPVVQ